MMGSRAAMAQTVQPRSQKNGLAGGLAGQVRPPAADLARAGRGGRNSSPRPGLDGRPVADPAQAGRSAQRTSGPDLAGACIFNQAYAGLAIQPMMSLAAIVARGRELVSSVVTQVGRRVFGL